MKQRLALLLLLHPCLFISQHAFGDTLACSFDYDPRSGTGTLTCELIEVPPIPPQPDPYPDEDPPENGGGGDGGGEPSTPEIPWIYDLDNDKRLDCWRGMVSSTSNSINLSRDWGYRVRDNGRLDFHPAWDIGTAGTTYLDAASPADGIIRKVNLNASNSLGRFVLMEVTSTGEYIQYAHLQGVNVVVNQNVKMGYPLGKVGNTGATGGVIHLHVTMWDSKAYYDTNMALRAGQNSDGADYYDYLYTKDPASFFKSSVCSFPGSVTDSNNTPPPGYTYPSDPTEPPVYDPNQPPVYIP